MDVRVCVGKAGAAGSVGCVYFFLEGAGGRGAPSPGCRARGVASRRQDTDMHAPRGRCGLGFAASLAVSVCAVVLFCECLIYYTAVLRCSWPELREEEEEEEEAPPLRALFLSDTHLLGAIRGHWFDKLRREWQMERAFQTALWALKPEVVFILGDVFDEGKWSSTEDWNYDVGRFRRMFRHPSSTELVVVVGNHDIGFHDEMTWHKLQRFEKVFNATSARILSRRGVNFLLVNSVALHGDRCPICQSVENELHRLSHALNCSAQGRRLEGMKQRCQDTELFPAAAPIILQHYPLYRPSDADCSGQDAAPPEDRHQLFHERYDVLSQEVSQRLLWWFKPRLILSGHTHSACHILHDSKYPEISVPSFSWRNRNNPSFIMGTFNSTDFLLSKCFLPEESSVIAVYCGSAFAILLIALGHFHLFRGTISFSGLMGKHKSM
ncbi:metallophosphoesterase 1 [Denticeps clupeoides]|uniref:Metallophosphoesterase 1 n=1 Tax=Denticeps clupeoides TaxID=299321 RepID=A0AAY4BGD0_9TELE|nr:metallophosphoesterase 1 [Denticeps clupeoides]